MSEESEPALSEKEWAYALDPDVRESLAYEVCYLWGRARPDAAIAIANAALPDSDPRKITREKIINLRGGLHMAAEIARDESAEGLAFLDALESYLPPEK